MIPGARFATAAALLLAASGCGSTTQPPAGTTACVSGFVLIGGAPVPGATVGASSGASAVTGVEGQFSLQLPPDSSVTLRVRAAQADSFFYADSVSLRTGAAGSACARHDFALGVSTFGSVLVTGHVDDNFAPVAGATVTAGGGRFAVTDAAGAYRFRLAAGEVVTLRAAAQVAGEAHHATMSFAAPADAPTGAAAIDLQLAPDRVAVHAEAWLESHFESGQLVSAAHCLLWHESDGTPVAGAKMSITTPDNPEVDFTPAALAGEYIATGYFTPGDPPLATADMGYRYTISVDVDGDGTVDATADVDGPPRTSVIDPPAHASRPTAFEAYWRGAPRPDSADYLAVLRESQAGIEFGSPVVRLRRFTSFSNVPPGAYTLRLRATRGGGLQPTPPNLVAAGVSGHFWSEFLSAAVPITVVTGGLP